MTFLLNSFMVAPAVATSATYVQKATKRYVSGSGPHTVTLPSAPTAGNVLVWVGAGYGPMAGATFVPDGFTAIQRFTTLNQQINCYAKLVGAGESGSYNLSMPNLRQAGVLYEFANVAAVVPIGGGDMSGFFSSSTFALPTARSPWGVNDIVLGAMEHDLATDFNLTAETGLTVDYNAGDADDHSCAFFQLAPTHDGVISGALASGTATNPVYGLFALVSSSAPN